MTTDKLENYEIINKGSNLIITYSLNDTSSLVGITDVNVIAVERKDGNFEVKVTSVAGKDLLELESMDYDTLLKMKSKKSVLAGISEKTNDFEEAALVNRVDIIPIPKAAIKPSIGGPLDSINNMRKELQFTNADAFDPQTRKKKF